MTRLEPVHPDRYRSGLPHEASEELLRRLRLGSGSQLHAELSQAADCFTGWNPTVT